MAGDALEREPLDAQAGDFGRAVTCGFGRGQESFGSLRYVCLLTAAVRAEFQSSCKFKPDGLDTGCDIICPPARFLKQPRYLAPRVLVGRGEGRAHRAAFEAEQVERVL